MKIKIKIEKEVDIRFVKVVLPIRYADEDMSYDFPLRKGDSWRATIEIDSGWICEWDAQFGAREFYVKVCDEGIYELIDSEGNSFKKLNSYAPNKLIPGEYGDYVNLKINSEGFITNWPKNPSVKEFFNEEED